MMSMEFPPPLAPMDTLRAGQERPLLQAVPDADNTTPSTRQQSAEVTTAQMPDLQQVLQASSRFFQEHQQQLSFSVDKISGRMVVSVIDSKTSEVIRQIPSEEMLEMSQRLHQLIDENDLVGAALLIEKSA